MKGEKRIKHISEQKKNRAENVFGKKRKHINQKNKTAEPAYASIIVMRLIQKQTIIV